mmetsp:Transcript_20713/g.61791  ORF Transcript_20713/g.61791 Transcript_20713/m.61791 type:complete len:1556 (-) Transcript_20713:252-4919(-)|eukprot:CAMPEP_0119262302 /NCGR_PEP_ID=MMETSP1329-20130426/2071_1 /TAXON_ID=114041 /ORGANISM="Genus nov. species nov., Strain RCC1024" /LENGTH=1555 /DNA_ID=CAMNT_0007261935 /DNA_START=136 /DNA_END=4803 /DNA_ORIENTATION=+
MKCLEAMKQTHDTRSLLLEEGSGAMTEASTSECEDRLVELNRKLGNVAIDLPLERLQSLMDSETHQSFLLKEMAWMSTDFEVERKRHAVLRKKRSKAIMQHFKANRGRLRRQELEIEVTQKRTAMRVARLIKHFWMKIDRIISYKRRLEWQTLQRKSMDKHLVHLVRKTERYTGELAERLNFRTGSSPQSEQGRSPQYGQMKEPNAALTQNCSGSGFTTQEEIDARTSNIGLLKPYILDSDVNLRPYQQAGLSWLVSMHERRLNGILADEMGLGKTLQTIALLGYLAGEKGLWGPHLIVVPTSCLVNWESELKRFCPSLKVVTYYGAAKARKQLRAGWSKASTVHVIITSYQLAVQDASIFRRKKFYYMILDEAHNIKNFDSRRWRTLLAFQTQRRLLLTGTPLQNSLMELWSLMHFLMPHLFRSRHEFSYWFANPLQCAVEGKSKISEELVKRLHSIMRPFVLRRLKKDVAKQLPGKYEHEVPCQLSRRQQLLYEEFLACSSTHGHSLCKSGGCNSFISMMNIVMQLRKVCNHPDLFEPRSVVSPLVLPRLVLAAPLETASTIKFSTAECSAICQCVLNADLGYLPSRELLAPVSLIESILTFEDNSLAVASQKSLDQHIASNHNQVHAVVEKVTIGAVLRHINKSASMIEATAPSNISKHGFEFIFGAFRPYSPLANAWGAVCGESGFICKSANNITNDVSRIRANRRRFMASDTLRQHLEEGALLWARYQNLFELVKRFCFVVPAVCSKFPIPVTVRLMRDNFGSERCFPAPLRERFKKPNSNDLSSCYECINATLSHMRYMMLALQVYFPERSLIQWDSGKFHELAPLLRQLKLGAHRCLIFTQMSKMLDVLEAFLCWHGHSYLRLDGGTPPGDRQRLMDRFNSDTLIFCFVLSTRSGGLGVNLTGADIVIFYDSDWNPAMDAQAMDRAHRIGQTRDVHIYRFICKSTIEENILLKARQKQKLEFVTMTEGKFDSQQIKRAFSTTSLREPPSQHKHPSKTEIAAIMAKLEDAVDVQDARAAAAEVASEAQEFDDTCRSNSLTDHKFESDNNSEAAALETEFAAWQQRIGPDPKALALSLSAVEQHALSQREVEILTQTTEISDGTEFFTLAERRLMEVIKKEKSGVDSNFDVDAIESLKQAEECRFCSEGELLATDLYFSGDINSALVAGPNKCEFLRLRQQAKTAKRKRECTGAAWELRMDAVTSDPFWYNVDTDEATWLKPLVIERRDNYLKACKGGVSSWPKEVSLRLVAMCDPIPTRRACALVCRNWATACTEDHLLLRVSPVVCLDNADSSYTSPNILLESKPKSCDKRQAPSINSVNSIATLSPLRQALTAARPGETLILGQGHYCEDNADILVSAEIRIVGDVIRPEHVIIELEGALRWCARRGCIVGIFLRRPPRINNKAISTLAIQTGSLACHRIIIDNFGGGGAAVTVHTGAYLHLDRSDVMNAAASGVFLHPGSNATLSRCNIRQNGHSGVSAAPNATCFLQSCVLSSNGRTHVYALPGSRVALECNQFGSAVGDTTRKLIDGAHGAFVVSKHNIGICDS